MDEILLEAESLRVYFPSKSGMVRAVEDVSFRVMAGETFGIIGESGCGKTTTGRALTGLIRPTGGQVRLCGRPLESGSRMERAGQIQMVFQDSQGALDPRYTVGRTIGEPLAVHKQGTAAQRRARTLALMADVGLSPELYDRYPHALSGGQRQRVGVARALALSPRVVVCDEPVSALDVSIQAQILALMAHLQGKYGLTYVFISHNLSVVRLICNRVAVMYLGRIVELGQREDIFQRAAHPYTAALLSAIPDPDPDAPQGGRVLEGDVPSPVNPPAGCVFHTRCTRCAQACTVQPPPLRELAAGHWVACHFPEGV